MAGGGVRVEGLSQAVRALKGLGLEVEDLKNAFATIAAEATELIASKTPRRSGRLAASVRGNRAQGKAVVRSGRASVPYAGPINYGWRKRNIEPSLFMQRGDVEYQPKAVQRLETELEAAITRKGLR
ncbi:MAG: hypothetical protein P1U38_09855 [Aeromicrobium sp.]|uniref:hypothetical protein n=1 Tax=Aeromicrobium sp. TaxID=1871063 RepID=UPI00262E4968|nr:hypothetical protein [Aeromicrobium sp.]MDF1705066.1 hypothetical protein [Aeromicrobium sp.]